jgi:hypothetical protein
MSIPIELPSGKLIDLDRCIALIPAEVSQGWQLVLDGMTQTLIVDPQDALVIKASISSLTRDLPPHVEPLWDREAQITRNQPAIDKIRSLIAKMESSEVSSIAAAEFDRFKEIVDSERPDGQKLYRDR